MKKQTENIWENINDMKIGDVHQNYPDNNSSERLLKTPFGLIYTYTNLQGIASVFFSNSEMNTELCEHHN